MKALGLVVLEKKTFYVFPMTPRGGARMDPRGTIGRIYKEDHYTLLHTKYKSSGPCGCGEVWTPGARLAGFIKTNTIYCY